MDKVYFVDASVFLEDLDYLINKELFIVPQIRSKLIEISEDKSKRNSIRQKASKALWFMECNSNNIHVYYNLIVDDVINYTKTYDCDDELNLCHYALAWHDSVESDAEKVFLTSDWLVYKMALEFGVGCKVEYYKRKPEPEYTGYKEVCLSDEEMAEFYGDMNDNRYDLLINQYLIIRNNNQDVVDVYRWDGEMHCPLKSENIKSTLLGPLKPYNGDVYQRCLLNSFANNKLTMVKGPAGTGKTACALGYLVYLLEKHKIDKIIVFTNTLPTLNSAKLGFYPGSRDSKLLDSSIGNILSSKFGDPYIVEKMIAENKLSMVPMCDIRGFDTSGANCGIICSEAQNLDIYLMKLALQRIGEDAICIIDGDYNAQVDNEQFAGENNGMRRLSKVFRGQPFYGEIELKNIYRSRIASLAEKM